MTINRLQVGLTAECYINKPCKFCNKNLLKEHGMSVNFRLKKESIIKVFRQNDINTVQFCANAGEALYHPDFEEILQVAREETNVGIEFNTNGAYRCVEWWNDLSKILDRDDDIVIFAIDGLKGVHEIHRSWSFETVSENMVSFIRGGGNAGWQFIVFKHNEHQLDLCKTIARGFGCKRFVVRNSRDYDDELQAPTTMNCNIDRTKLFDVVYEKNIKCWSKDPINLLFISATGHFWPCPAIAGVYMLKPLFATSNSPQKLSDRMMEEFENEKDGILNIDNEQNLEKIMKESKLWDYILSHTEVESVCNCYCNENRGLFGDMNKNFHRIMEF
jgi:MoaA/NifB/PqqE/SkfB family radical SAM enzyme